MPCRLYLISPSDLPDLVAFAGALEAACGAGDVAAFQLRLKGATDDAVIAAARRLFPLAQARGVACILNDRMHLVQAAGADGVHLGQGDGDPAEARRLLGRDAMIGVTCHDSRHLGMEAAEAGADYVAFGAFHPTETKQTVHRPDPEILTIWQETMQIPCVAIGGITVDNAGALARAGADFVAVSAGVWANPDGPAAAVAAFERVLADAG